MSSCLLIPTHQNKNRTRITAHPTETKFNFN